MSKINKVDSVRRSSGISPTVSSGATNQTTTINFREQFNFPEIKLPARAKSNVEPQERLNFLVMVNLFLEILQSGVDIVPQAPRDHGNYVVEASFMPSHNKKQNHKILAPLRGVNDPLIASSPIAISNSLRYKVEDYVSIIIDNSTDEDIIRLLIVISHEFGHYLSFIRGYHDKMLKYGIYLLNTKQASETNDKYTWLVFREEVTAWRYGEDVLSRYKFEFLTEYHTVKYSSLHTYYVNLKLEKASLDVYFKLSMLGDDFINSCKG